VRRSSDSAVVSSQGSPGLDVNDKYFSHSFGKDITMGKLFTMVVGIQFTVSIRAIISIQPPSPSHLSYPRVSLLPQVEEFLVMLYGFGCVTQLFVDLAQHVEAFCIYIKCSAENKCEVCDDESYLITLVRMKKTLKQS
jgi:hypothetical protein